MARTPIEIATAVRAREQKAVEVLDEHLAAIEAHQRRLNAFTVVDEELAREAAAAVDAMIARDEDPGPFAGVPFGVKDLYNAAGFPTSKGSRLFTDRGPVAVDDPDVARLRGAGAVPVGKTTIPEFGTVAFTASTAWGVTRNPWDLTRTPGGSSGGSAAAVASGMVPMATSGDGGGSTRIPAAFTGLVGLKASYGRIPYPDNNPSQTDTHGILVATVADAARHLDVTSGPHPADRTSLPPPAGVYEQLIQTLDVSGLRIGWSLDLGFAVVDPSVAEIVESAARALARAAGLTLTPVEVRLTDPVQVWLGAGALDLYHDMDRGMYPERAEELEGITRAMLALSDPATPPQLTRVWQRRQRLEKEVGALHEEVDVLLTPTTAVAAFAAEGPMPTEINGQTVFPAMATPFTMVANLSWNPAISVPAGVTAGGLPVGLQIQGPRHADEIVLRLARIWEQTQPWPLVAPGYER